MNTRFRIFLVFAITLVAIIGIAVYIGFYSQRSRAAVGLNGVNIVFSPSSATNQLINTNQTTNVTLSPVTSTYKISGMDLKFVATGNLQIVDITAPAALPNQLVKTVTAQNARIVYTSNLPDAQLPSLVQFQVIYKGSAAGNGTIQITTNNSSVTGTIPTASFDLDSTIPTGTFSFIAPSVAPTNTPPDNPVVTLPTCIGQDYKGTGITFSWTNTKVTYLQISGDKDFAVYPSTKMVNVGSTSTTGPEGFAFFGAPLALKPGAPYFARTNNGTNSSGTQFTIPDCTSLTPTVTPTPTITPTPTAGVPALTFIVLPQYINNGASGTITWSSSNINSCTASGGWTGTKGPSGSESTGPLTATTTYNLDCTGTSGPISHTTTINVNPTPTPTKTPTPTPCPNRINGDANCDGQTNLTDFEFWRREFQQVSVTKNADFNGDGTVNLIDFEMWRSKAFAQ